jgi:hypothetical protein
MDFRLGCPSAEDPYDPVPKAHGRLPIQGLFGLRAWSAARGKTRSHLARCVFYLGSGESCGRSDRWIRADAGQSRWTCPKATSASGPNAKCRPGPEMSLLGVGRTYNGHVLNDANEPEPTSGFEKERDTRVFRCSLASWVSLGIRLVAGFGNHLNADSSRERRPILSPCLSFAMLAPGDATRRSRITLAPFPAA